MNAILKRLQHLGDDELATLGNAVDAELGRRLERENGVPDSARRRAVARGVSYRRCNGASAPPIRAVGFRDTRRRRAA